MTRSIPAAVLALWLVSGGAFAQQAPADAALPAWEQLSPAQRELLVAPIRERWNAAPEERARMLERAERLRSLTPEQRRRAHHGMRRFDHMDSSQREHARALYHALLGMDPARRKAFLAEWKAKTPQQRQAWLEAHPAPPQGPAPARP